MLLLVKRLSFHFRFQLSSVELYSGPERGGGEPVRRIKVK